MTLSREDVSAATERGDVDVLRAYVESLAEGEAVNEPVDVSTGETLLHVASAAGQEACVQALIDARCKLAVLDNDDQNALHYACNEGHLDTAKLLIGAGIGAEELNRLDKYQMSPLHLAVEGGHLELVRFLTGLPQADEKIRRGSVTFIAQRHEHNAIVDLLQRPREVYYDEHGERVPRSSSGSSILAPPVGGRTAAARRRSRAQSEDAGSTVSTSTIHSAARGHSQSGQPSQPVTPGAASAENSRAPSRVTTPRNVSVRRDSQGDAMCGKGCALM